MARNDRQAKVRAHSATSWRLTFMGLPSTFCAARQHAGNASIPVRTTPTTDYLTAYSTRHLFTFSLQAYKHCSVA